MKRSLFFLVLFLFSSKLLLGQVFPPDLLCVSNDTLKWDTPTNSCGLFNNYTVFGSLELTGPYDTIAVITDQSATSFFHGEASGRDWFYFMQSDFNCPGQITLSSDTLDNRIPEGSPIQFVSVGNNGVEVRWQDSPSPEVFAYIIYRQTPAGTTVIDTVTGGNTFVDLDANVEDQVETYFVNSLDRCGNVSLFTDPHSTILVNVTGINTCEQTISLEWNLYLNWAGGIDRHEVWLSTNGGNFASIATLDANTNTFVFEDANDLDTYCFFVRAYQSGTEFFSRSNVVCETPDLVQPVKEFALLNASVTENDSVELTWIWDTRSEINEFTVNRSRDSFNLSPIAQATPNLPLSNTNNYLDTDPVLSGQPRYYQVQTTDLCDTMAFTNIVATVALTAEARSGGSNILSWTPYYNSTGQIIDYEVFRIIDGQEELIAGSLDATTFNDEIDISDPTQTSACYYVVARANVILPSGSINTIRSRSNTACVEQSAEVFVPNAFVPGSFNSEFRPVLQFGAPEQYSMSIFDRWGGLLFETNSLETGWDGKNMNERPMPQGVYAYYIRLVQSGGQLTEKKGTVLLLR